VALLNSWFSSRFLVRGFYLSRSRSGTKPETTNHDPETNLLLALPHLVTRIGADDPQTALSPDDFAIFTAALD
jgi:hypothetical protein